MGTNVNTDIYQSYITIQVSKYPWSIASSISRFKKPLSRIFSFKLSVNFVFPALYNMDMVMSFRELQCQYSVFLPLLSFNSTVVSTVIKAICIQDRYHIVFDHYHTNLIVLVYASTIVFECLLSHIIS